MSAQLFKVEITSRKRIKPSSPTPQDQTTFNLSLWDRGMPHVHPSIIFFYPSADNTDQKLNTNIADILTKFSQISLRLQKALSDTLVYYYPLAGKATADSPNIIQCNDRGAYWVEACVLDCDHSGFLRQKPEVESLNKFIPSDIDPLFDTTCILAIQLTLFKCGGVIITVSVCHKFMDASSLVTFVRSWTAMARGEPGDMVPMQYVGSSVLPSEDLLSTPRVRGVGFGPTVARRLVFSSSKIAILKAKFQQRLSGADIILGLILKCVVKAAAAPTGARFVVFQIVDLRNRLDPSMPDTTIGNIIWMIPVIFQAFEAENDELPGKIRKTLNQLYEDKGSKIRVKEEYSVESVEGAGAIAYACSSLSKLPLYDIDFGLGKPTWVTHDAWHPRNYISLLGSGEGDGSIEAWVSLEEKEMQAFERNTELHAYAILDSPVIPPPTPGW